MNKKKEFIAYRGDSFTVEWYFNDKGESESLIYYQSLSMDERIQLLKLFKRMGDCGEIRDKTKFVYEGDKIYAFKPQPDRFLCFFCEGKKIIVTNAFRKKQQKLPVQEKEKALQIREDYMTKTKQRIYYE